MFMSQVLSKIFSGFLTLVKNWLLLSYALLWLGLKETILNIHAPIFKVIAPLFNIFSAVGLFSFLFISYRCNSIIEAYRALFFIGLAILVLPAIPTMLIPVGVAIMSTMFMLKVVESFKNFLKPGYVWKSGNILNSIFSDESVLLSGLVIAFSLASESFTPVFVLGAIQGVNLLIKATGQIYEYFTRPKNPPKNIPEPAVVEQENPTCDNDLTPVNTTEHLERTLDLLKDSSNDYLLSADNNFYFRHAAEIGRWDIVLRLLKKPNVASNVTCNDCAVISLALQQNQWPFIKKILKNSFYINSPFTEGKIETISTLFAKMIAQEKIDVMNLMVCNGFYKHYAHSGRRTMLFFAAAHNELTILNILLKSNKLLRLLKFEGFSLLFQVLSDDTITKLSNSNQSLIEHVQNRDWQDATLFDLPVKHLIDKKDLSSWADCKLFFTNTYGFLNQKLKNYKLNNLFAARFIATKNRYNETITVLNGFTTELNYLDDFSSLKFFKFLNELKFRMTLNEEIIALGELIERICAVSISRAFELKIKENPKWTYKDKKNALNSLTYINNQNVNDIFLATEPLLIDMSFAENFMKHYIEIVLPKIIKQLFSRLPNNFSFKPDDFIKERCKEMVTAATYHFFCMGESYIINKALNNAILNSDCVIQDVHFEQDCLFAEESKEQKLFMILATRLNEEVKNHRAYECLKIIQLKEITRICNTLVVSQLKNQENFTLFKDLKTLIRDININELETFLTAEAIKLNHENESTLFTPQFNMLPPSRNDATITPTMVSAENNVIQPRVL